MSGNTGNGPVSLTCVIAQVATERLRQSLLDLPEGYDQQSLTDINSNIGWVGIEVVLQGEEAAALATIGRQILTLDEAGMVQPPLQARERQSISHLVDVVSHPTGPAGVQPPRTPRAAASARNPTTGEGIRDDRTARRSSGPRPNNSSP